MSKGRALAVEGEIAEKCYEKWDGDLEGVKYRLGPVYLHMVGGLEGRVV